MELGEFREKWNKVSGNIYTVEEEISLTDGVYEGELSHDNINVDTFAVYTGPKLTGDRIDTYTLSTPASTPWKRILRVYADGDITEVYVSYETEGDTVEADDINHLQEEVLRAQKAVTEEEVRAAEAEKANEDAIAEEAERAIAEEKTNAAAIIRIWTWIGEAEKALVPAGGLAEQVLVKSSEQDYDMDWISIESLSDDEVDAICELGSE